MFYFNTLWITNLQHASPIITFCLLALIYGKHVLLEIYIKKTPQIKNDIGKKSSKELDYRTEHGERYAQACPYIGMTNQPFGRYAKPCSKYGLYDPDPQVVADELLTRTIDKTVDGNLFIATWIQFMIHDWISHKTNPVEEIKLNDSMKIERTVFHEDTTYTINENNSL